MAVYKIIHFGDELGVGSVIQKTNFWGSVTTWTLIPNKEELYDKWVCRESGENWYKSCTDMEEFYQAQYRTKHHEKNSK